MTTKVSLRIAAIVILCGFLLTFSAQGDINIAVNNSSFEILPPGGLAFHCGPGCAFSAAAIPGWNDNPFSSGQFQPGTQAGNHLYFDTLSDGITSAYSNGGTISQTVGATVAAGRTYVLTIDIGQRHDGAIPGTADLLVNGTHYDVVPDPLTSPPVSGGWATYTATYVGLAADAGDAITIELNSNGFQGNYDNVRLVELTGTATPEPPFYALTGVAFAALLMEQRRRAKKRT